MLNSFPTIQEIHQNIHSMNSTEDITKDVFAAHVAVTAYVSNIDNCKQDTCAVAHADGLTYVCQGLIFASTILCNKHNESVLVDNLQSVF